MFSCLGTAKPCQGTEMTKKSYYKSIWSSFFQKQNKESMHLKNYIPLLMLNTSVFKPEALSPIKIGQKTAWWPRLKIALFTTGLACDVTDRHGLPHNNIVNSPESVEHSSSCFMTAFIPKKWKCGVFASGAVPVVPTGCKKTNFEAHWTSWTYFS